MSKIHPSSYVSPHTILGDDVEIGPFCVIHDNVVLMDQVTIGSYCELGVRSSVSQISEQPTKTNPPLIIGANSFIRSHSIFYEASVFGEGLTTGHRVTVRENTKAGVGFQIGTLTEIQGDCVVGDHVRFQSNIFVGKETVIGNFVWILPYVVLTNDPTPPSDKLVGCVIEDYATLCAASIILPGILVGHHSLVGAAACVTKNVEPHMAVVGNPAKIIGKTKDIKLRDGSGRAAYPWVTHFKRGYPESVVAEWDKTKE